MLKIDGLFRFLFLAALLSWIVLSRNCWGDQLMWDKEGKDYNQLVATKYDIIPAPFNVELELNAPQVIATKQKFLIEALLYDMDKKENIYGLRIILPAGFVLAEPTVTKEDKEYVFSLIAPTDVGVYTIAFEVMYPVEITSNNPGMASYEVKVLNVNEFNPNTESTGETKTSIKVKYGSIKALVKRDAQTEAADNLFVIFVKGIFYALFGWLSFLGALF